jgi:YD repeat-containing protein
VLGAAVPRWDHRTYDTVGNRLTEKIGVQPQTTYTYDNVDQLTQTVQGTSAPVVFAYNANGDQTKAGNVISTFNAARQTVGVTTPTGAVTYAYDGDGNRVSSLVTAAGGSSLKTTYDWDTASGGLANVVAEHDDTGVVQRRYSYGNELLSIATPQAKSFALTDPLGTVTHLVSPTGVVQAEYTTSPWGVANSANNVLELLRRSFNREHFEGKRIAEVDSGERFGDRSYPN